MRRNQATTFAVVAEQLADDLACAVSDLASDTIRVVPLVRREGGRSFPFSARTVQVVTMGRGAVVSCDASRTAAVEAALRDVAPQNALSVPALCRLQALLA